MILDAVAERLIPSDEHGPGAREANVTGYIRSALADAYRDDLPAYSAGLRALDEQAVAAHGSGFCELSPERQDALLTAVETGEPPGDAFFELVRRHALEGMFGDPAWGGNAGFAGWDLIGYPGVRKAWTEAEQQLDVVLAPAHQGLADLGGSTGEQR